MRNYSLYKKCLGIIGSLTFATSSFAQSIPEDFKLEQLKQYVEQKTSCEELSCSSISQVSLEDINWSKKELKLSFNVQARVLNSFLIPLNIQNINIKGIILDGKEWASANKLNNQINIALPEGNHKVDLLLGFNNNFINLEFLGKPKNFTNLTKIENIQLSDRGNSYFVIINNSNSKSEVISSPTEEKNMNSLLPTKPFFVVSRQLTLEQNWKVTTTVNLLEGSIINQPVELNIPLLPGEKLLTEGYENDKGKIKLLMSNNTIVWDSILPIQEQIIIAPKDNSYIEKLTINSSKDWLYDYKGLNPSGENKAAINNKEWYFWNGEELKLKFIRPLALQGAYNTVANYKTILSANSNPLKYDIEFDYVTSLGGRTYVEIPTGYALDNLMINGIKIDRTIENNKLALDVLRKTNNVKISLKTENDLIGLVSFPQLKFDTTVRNKEYYLNDSQKWLIFARGADVSPAVLLWGILISLTIFSLILSKTNITPFSTFSWTILLFGLTQSSLISCLIVVGTILLYGIKLQIFKDKNQSKGYNFYQILLIIGSIVSMLIFLFTLKQGLLHLPNIFIDGVNSNSNSLYWYAENETSSEPWAIFVPMWVYRVLMFAWAMWIAVKSIHLIKWMWLKLNDNILWRKKEDILIIEPEDIPVLTEKIE